MTNGVPPDPFELDGGDELEVPSMEPLAAAQTLDRAQFRRYLHALEAESAILNGKPPPSSLGRVFKPAETERKLVLFTLGIIVILIVVAVFVIEMWDDNPTPSAVTTPLVTLAGTGLGFIGGMVSNAKPSPPGDQPPAEGEAPV